MPQKLIAVVGPTASGKTALVVQLSHLLNGEVISCDSMQIYRYMQIGTAAPTPDETEGIPHHLIGFVHPGDDFSCADYAEHAKKIIREIAARGKLPILCGGTGLYLDSLLRVSDFSESEKSQEIRTALTEFAERHGNDALHKRLRTVDPASADAIHPNNVRRVIRALEIYKTTGITKSEWDRRSLVQVPEYEAQKIVLNFHNRELLYRRIDQRVDRMMEAGLEEEVRTLFEKNLLTTDKGAGQAIGYKEFLPYFAGECSLTDVINAIKLASRRYAKRQLTWFRRYMEAIWLYPDTENSPQSPMKNAKMLAEEAVEELRKRGFLS